MAIDAAGDYVITWFSLGNPALLDIYAQRFQSNFTPTVTAATSVNVTRTTATLGGDVTNRGDSSLTAVGVLYALTSTDADPHLGESGDVVGEHGGDVVDVKVGSVDRVVSMGDQLGDVRSRGLGLPPLGDRGLVVGRE